MVIDLLSSVRAQGRQSNNQSPDILRVITIC
jgi:hypothetical protein